MFRPWAAANASAWALISSVKGLGNCAKSKIRMRRWVKYEVILGVAEHRQRPLYEQPVIAAQHTRHLLG